MNKLCTYFFLILTIFSLSRYVDAAQITAAEEKKTEIAACGEDVESRTIAQELKQAVDDLKKMHVKVIWDTFREARFNEPARFLANWKAFGKACFLAPEIFSHGVTSFALRMGFDKIRKFIPLTKQQVPLLYAMTYELAQRLHCPAPLICLNPSLDNQDIARYGGPLTNGSFCFFILIGYHFAEQLDNRMMGLALAHEIGHIRSSIKSPFVECSDHRGHWLEEVFADNLAIRATLDPDAFIGLMNHLGSIGGGDSGASLTHPPFAMRIKLAEKIKQVLLKSPNIAKLCVQHANSRTSMF